MLISSREEQRQVDLFEQFWMLWVGLMEEGTQHVLGQSFSPTGGWLKRLDQLELVKARIAMQVGDEWRRSYWTWLVRNRLDGACGSRPWANGERRVRDVTIHESGKVEEGPWKSPTVEGEGE